MTRSVGGLQLFEGMRQSGVQPNAAIYSAMASVFARCGNLERSIEVANLLFFITVNGEFAFIWKLLVW
jgi:hypothetical protein